MTFKGYLFKMNRNIVLGLCVLALQVQLASSGIPGLTGLFDGITQGLSTQAIAKLFETTTTLNLFQVQIQLNITIKIGEEEYNYGCGNLSLPAIVTVFTTYVIYQIQDKIFKCIGMAMGACVFLVMTQLTLANLDQLNTIFVNVLKTIDRATNPAFK